MFLLCIPDLPGQSSVDQLMAFRLWKYILLLAERHIDKKEKIPLIFPLVVYAGKAKYTATRNLWSLFEYPELAKKLLTEDHALVDLQAMSDDEIAKKKHLALFEYIMKHVQMRDMLKLWQNLFEKLPDAVMMLCASYSSPPLRQMRSPLYTNFFA